MSNRRRRDRRSCLCLRRPLRAQNYEFPILTKLFSVSYGRDRILLCVALARRPDGRARDRGTPGRGRDPGSGNGRPGTGAMAEAQALVIDTETRHLGTAEAARVVARLARAASRRGRGGLQEDGLDSAGNIAAELVAMREVWPDRPVVYVPAYPALGRTVRRGRLYVHGVPWMRRSSRDRSNDPDERDRGSAWRRRGAKWWMANGRRRAGCGAGDPDGPAGAVGSGHLLARWALCRTAGREARPDGRRSGGRCGDAACTRPRRSRWSGCVGVRARRLAGAGR